MAKAGAAALFSKGSVDTSLDQLFSNSLSKAPLKAHPSAQVSQRAPAKDSEDSASQSAIDDSEENAEDNDTISSGDESLDSEGDEGDVFEGDEGDEDGDELSDEDESDSGVQLKPEMSKREKRKRDDDAGLEDRYLAKLARTDAAADKRVKRQKGKSGEAVKPAAASDDGEADDVEDNEEESDYEIPKHETQDGSSKNNEVERANRTVFLGNVSTDAIKLKDSMKTLKAHLVSHLSTKKGEDASNKVESVRFRSVAFASTALPRKAAFAKKDLMDATTKSTNAYVVYSSPAVAKSAVETLNGTVVLDRHLRVDSVAHPTPIDHRRCVFVGNLGFVDDESLMQVSGDADEKLKKKKQPGDVEEGLWRQFGKAGTVESVRVVRDKSTRVGKGFAYVQFTDQVAVEKALDFNEKKFPPMLPRQLRVTRAKKITKTNAYKEKARGPGKDKEIGKGKTYNPKIDTAKLTAKGRATKMFGRAGAAQMKTGKGGDGLGDGVKRPEDFVFEGHRARDAEGKRTMNLKQKKQKSGKPQTRSSKRGAAFKAAGRKKKSSE